jgi:ATP-dependent helicase Lhr and Lhr-like helicase
MSLSDFHPIISEWFTQQLGTPTDIQNRAWPLIQQGKHVLVTAPTGGGKTLAAFLWAMHQLIGGHWETGQTRVLYISPLKALNNDIQRNLLTPLAQLRSLFAEKGQDMPDIRVLTRSGDTPAHERHKMRRSPPEILITTPESLNILLTSKGSHALLTGIQTVILDEIHAVVNSKRGTHLITAVDRLVLLAGEFQRIALSATVKPLDTVAQFVGGYQQTGTQSYVPRQVVTVCSQDPKSYNLKVDFPEDAREQLVDDSWWPGLTRCFRDSLAQNRSTLLFANSRRLVEKVSRLINEDQEEVLVYAHHGSLAKEIRLAVEQKLKKGQLQGIVATNSLELGIDIGSLDEVVLIQTPLSVAGTVQRLGRAGHQVGQVSKGSIFPTHGMDFLYAAVMTRAVYEGDIESVEPVHGALDVLTQVVLSLCVTQTWDIEELFGFLKTSHPFHELPRAQFDLVIQMLEGRYADTRVRELKPRIMVDRLDNTVRAKDSAAFLLYMAGGTIPDRGYYDLRLQDSKAKIGELDEEFVWERSIGDTFALGNQVWHIQRITHNHVEVTPGGQQLNIIPFWKADSQDAAYHFAAKVADFLEWANEQLDQDTFKPTLMRDYHMTPSAAAELTAYLLRQREACSAELPHRHHMLIEQFQDPAQHQDATQLILYTFWGGRVNRPFALALSAAWQEAYHHPLQVFVNNDAVLLMLPSECQPQTLMALLTPDNVESYLVKKLEQTGYFGARFRENAGRALLLPKQNFKKRMPLWLNRLRSKKLLQTIQGFEDFPILLETWRGCLRDEFDLPNLKACLEEIRTHEIHVTAIKTTKPSPFADGLVWRQTNQYMYEDDTPLASDKVSLKTDLLRELLFSSHLRPKIPKALIENLEAKRQRTHPGYAPDHPDELMQHVKDRLLIPLEEWSQLQLAMQRDLQERGDSAFDTLIESIAPKLAKIAWCESDSAFICARESIGRIQDLFCSEVKVAITDLSNESIDPPNACPAGEDPGQDPLAQLEPFIGQWLSFYGPMAPESLRDTFGLQTSLWQQILEDLVNSEQIVCDSLTEKTATPEICDCTNLEILLRMLRRSQQPGFQARALAELPVFLASFQGLVRPGNTPDTLQRILNQLFGLSLPPQLWEEIVFPSRLAPYFGAWLDSLTQTHGLLLLGQPNKKLSFMFPEDVELFQTEAEKVPSSSGPIPEQGPAWDIEPSGRYSLLDLSTRTSLPSSELTSRLWQAFWQGQMSVDAFAALRKGIVSKFQVQTQAPASRSGSRSRRSGFTRWKAERPIIGNWYCVPRSHGTHDPIEREELKKDRVRQLLSRYGILFRELLQREQLPLQWRSLFRTLRLMEFSGEVVSAQFFSGIPGLQFMNHEAFDILKQGIAQDAVFWINACDPASLCGSGLKNLKEDLPSRLPSNFMVYHGSHVVMIVTKNGKSLQCRTDPGHARMQEYLSLFKVLITRDFNPRKRVIVETINDIPAPKSPYRDEFLQFGFATNIDRLELWKRY